MKKLPRVKEILGHAYPHISGAGLLVGDRKLIRNAVRLVTRRLGCPGLAGAITIKTGFINAGDGWAVARKTTIFINRTAWKSYGKKPFSVLLKKSLIAHEVCHLANDYFHHSRRAYRRFHGKSFFSLLKKAGFLAFEKKFYQNGPAWYRRLIP